MIFLDQIYIIFLPIQQVMKNNKLVQRFFFGRNLLRKGANMQKSNELKKLCLAFFSSKVTQELQVFINLKTLRLACFKNARRDVFGFLITYIFLITFEEKKHKA